MQLDFTKMQSLGNDFVMLDGVSRKMPLSSAMVRRLADRHYGIGCDQILLAENSPVADFRFRIFNQDGSEVEQCGNGARCLARFVHDRGLTDQYTISVETLNTRMRLELLDDGAVRVEMGVPEFLPERIPFLTDQPAERYALEVQGERLAIMALSLGNPHAVLLVEDVHTAPVERLGPLVENHVRFPARVNVGFCQIVARDRIRLRVHERGVGETLGCGSGACAAVVAGVRLGRLDPVVCVSLPGGEVWVQWNGEAAVHLTGPAQTVYTGHITLPVEFERADDSFTS